MTQPLSPANRHHSQPASASSKSIRSGRTTQRHRIAVVLGVIATVAATVIGLAPAAQAANSHNPIGHLDNASFVNGQFRVSGWALDPDTAQPIKVHVYLNRSPVVLTADINRPDVGRAHRSAGPRHGFALASAPANGTYQVCAYAINVGPGTANTTLGCRNVTVANNPLGQIAIARVPGGLRVSGWALDPNSPSSVQVNVGVDAARYHVIASAADPGVAAKYPYYGAAHGYQVTVPVTAGTRLVCAGVVNVGPGQNTNFGCWRIGVVTSPFGHLDSVRRTGPTTMSLGGWGLDLDSAASATVRITVDGTAYRSLTANAARPDVAARYAGYGAARGFNLSLPIDGNEHRVCATVANVGDGVDTQVGCADLWAQNATPPSPPTSLVVWPGSTTLDLTWDVPASTNGAEVNSYAVRWGTNHLAYLPATARQFRISGLRNNVRTAVTVVAHNLKGWSPTAAGSGTPVPIPPQRTPAPVSTSHYVRNITGVAAHDAPLMRAMGAADAAHNPSGHRYLTLLQIGGQVESSGGVYLSATSRFVSYPAVVAAMRAYLDGYHSRQKVYAPMTLAIGTNNDIDVSAGAGASWARNVVNPVRAYAPRYPGIGVAGANDIEPGFSATAAQSKAWLSGYLGATPASFVFNGSADGCSTATAASRCNNGWTMADLQWLSGGAAASRITSLPQIYNSAMPLQWRNISLTGTNARRAKINFGGPLTEYTACAQAGSCYSVGNITAWQDLWSAISSSPATRQYDMPHGTDLRIN